MANTLDFSRRSFVKGAAGVAAAAAMVSGAGLALAADDKAPAPSYKAGTYTATAPGRNGDVTVEVTFSDDAIVDAKVVEHRETALIGAVACDRLPAALVADQHLEADTFGGATLSGWAVQTALMDCVEQAGGDADAISAPVERPVPEDEECDVLVVGGGGSGIAAAIELAKQGCKVILVEKEDILGGTSNTASTYLAGWGSRAQVEQGIDALEAFKALGSYYYPPTLVEQSPEIAERYINIIPETLDNLADHGADLTRIIDGKWQCSPSDGSTAGFQVMSATFKMLDETDVDVRLGHALTALQIADDGSICGGEVTCRGGAYKVDAKAVYLGSGTYIINPELVARFNPEWAHLGATVSCGNTGECMIMAEEAGGVIENVSDITLNPAAYVANGSRSGMVSLGPCRYNGGILVGRSTGTRFADDLGGYTMISLSMPESKAYLIFDQTVMDSSNEIQDYYELGYFTKGETVTELAELIDLDPDVLQETIDVYSGYAQSGVDEEFGRTSMLSDLTSMPLYSAPIEPAMHNPHGGLTTNARGEVLNADGKPLGGLWAASGAVNNLILPNAMHGNMYFSRIIAQEIASDIA